ncbi:MAG: SgcJ/EcaC family oxidoreductase [Bacteroidales bacterium]|nr:MAG: SgcJ/EcaC family oxidoreductase [Bacteroidales bacterium]
MKKLILNFPVLLFMIGIFFSCSQNKKEKEVEADIAAINELYNNYIQCVNTDDLDNFMSTWADDAIRMEPGTPKIVGKENIRARFEPIFEQFTNKMVLIGEPKVQVSGDMAFGYGEVTLTSTPKEEGPVRQTDIKWLDCLKKQADGSWKVYIDCINFHPTWSKDSIPSEMMEEQKKPY